MNYDLSSISKFGYIIKDKLSSMSFDMINKYKESARGSAFDKKVEKDEQSDKETN